MNQRIIELLNQADSALRENLQQDDLDGIARAHLERALNHVREAHIATNEIGKARTVQRLAGDLEKVDLLFAKIRNSNRPEVRKLRFRQ